MFFPELKDLKTKYNIPEDTIEKLDTWLAYLRANQKKYILPEFFAREYGIPHQVVRELFYYATSVGVLEINYEVHCPFCDDMAGLEVHDTKDIPNEKIQCECGKEYNPSLFHEKIIISFNLIKTPNKSDKKKLLV